MQQSSFEDIWKQVEKLHILPIQAIDQVPGALSDVLKKQMTRRTPEEIALIVSSSVDEINSGLVNTIDELVYVYKGCKLC